MWFLLCCNHSSCLGEVEANREAGHNVKAEPYTGFARDFGLNLSHTDTHTLLNAHHNRLSGSRRPQALRTFEHEFNH